jgi:hypothetical protein
VHVHVLAMEMIFWLLLCNFCLVIYSCFRPFVHDDDYVPENVMSASCLFYYETGCGSSSAGELTLETQIWNSFLTDGY